MRILKRSQKEQSRKQYINTYEGRPDFKWALSLPSFLPCFLPPFFQKACGGKAPCDLRGPAGCGDSGLSLALSLSSKRAKAATVLHFTGARVWRTWDRGEHWDIARCRFPRTDIIRLPGPLKPYQGGPAIRLHSPETTRKKECILAMLPARCLLFATERPTQDANWRRDS